MLFIIKLDVFKKKVVGKIIDCFESNGLEVIVMKCLYLSVKDVENFYVIYRERFFFKDLIEFMVSGLVVVMVLEGKDVVVKNRDFMGVIDFKFV